MLYSETGWGGDMARRRAPERAHLYATRSAACVPQCADVGVGSRMLVLRRRAEHQVAPLSGHDAHDVLFRKSAQVSPDADVRLRHEGQADGAWPHASGLHDEVHRAAYAGGGDVPAVGHHEAGQQRGQPRAHGVHVRERGFEGQLRCQRLLSEGGA